MKRIIYWVLITIVMGIQSSYAQKKHTSDYHFKQAEELWQNDGDLKEILNLLDKQLEETPKHSDALCFCVLMYILRRKNTVWRYRM